MKNKTQVIAIAVVILVCLAAMSVIGPGAYVARADNPYPQPSWIPKPTDTPHPLPPADGDIELYFRITLPPPDGGVSNGQLWGTWTLVCKWCYSNQPAGEWQYNRTSFTYRMNMSPYFENFNGHFYGWTAEGYPVYQLHAPSPAIDTGYFPFYGPPYNGRHDCVKYNYMDAQIIQGYNASVTFYFTDAYIDDPIVCRTIKPFVTRP